MERFGSIKRLNQYRNEGFHPSSHWIFTLGNDAGTRIAETDLRKEVKELVAASPELEKHTRTAGNYFTFDKELFVQGVQKYVEKHKKRGGNIAVRSMVVKLERYLTSLS